jgi:predicted enzyme related to lactoylglutathione lyase
MADTPTTPVAFTKLVVRDLQKAAVFYRAVCGYGEGQFVKSQIAGRPMEEIIFPRPEGQAGLILLTYSEGPAPSPSGVITGFNTRDLDAFQARVLAAGGSVVQETKPLSFGAAQMRYAFFADPEGYVMEVIER